MNKQKAFELAYLELPENSARKEKRDRAMEIYAAAFAEWALRESFVKIPPNIWMVSDLTEDRQYTISDLITEFENQ